MRTLTYSPTVNISLALIVQNEGSCLDKALSNSAKYFNEIIVIDGESSDDTINIASKYTDKIFTHKFEKDFSKQRNIAISHCTMPYIFMLDADEIIEEELLVGMKDILLQNPEIDAFFLPRINTIERLEDKPWLISRYGWRINDKGWVNYPDFQCRIFKNSPKIKWEKPVHEQLVGYETYTMLEGLHLMHHKDWTRQSRQNEFYDTF